MPYAIENIETGAIVRRFASMPEAFDLPDGRRVVAPVAVGDEGLGHRFIEVIEVNFSRPGPYYTQGDDTTERDGNTITVTREWVAWTQQEIDAHVASQRDTLAAMLDQQEDILRAVFAVFIDEFNRHSEVHRSILAAAAAATSLADFKTRMGDIQGIPERTFNQLRQAVRNKLGT